MKGDENMCKYYDKRQATKHTHCLKSSGHTDDDTFAKSVAHQEILTMIFSKSLGHTDDDSL